MSLIEPMYNTCNDIKKNSSCALQFKSVYRRCRRFRCGSRTDEPSGVRINDRVSRSAPRDSSFLDVSTPSPDLHGGRPLSFRAPAPWWRHSADSLKRATWDLPTIIMLIIRRPRHRHIQPTTTWSLLRRQSQLSLVAVRAVTSSWRHRSPVRTLVPISNFAELLHLAATSCTIGVCNN